MEEGTSEIASGLWEEATPSCALHYPSRKHSNARLLKHLIHVIDKIQ